MRLGVVRRLVRRAEREKREKRTGNEVSEELWDADHVRP